MADRFIQQHHSALVATVSNDGTGLSPGRISPSILDPNKGQLLTWLRCDSLRPKRDRRKGKALLQLLQA